MAAGEAPIAGMWSLFASCTMIFAFPERHVDRSIGMVLAQGMLTIAGIAIVIIDLT